MVGKHNQNAGSLCFKSVAGIQNGPLILYVVSIKKCNLLCHACLLIEGKASQVFNCNFLNSPKQPLNYPCGSQWWGKGMNHYISRALAQTLPWPILCLSWDATVSLWRLWSFGQVLNNRIRDGGWWQGLGINDTVCVDMEREAILLMFCCSSWSSKVHS